MKGPGFIAFGTTRYQILGSAFVIHSCAFVCIRVHSWPIICMPELLTNIAGWMDWPRMHTNKTICRIFGTTQIENERVIGVYPSSSAAHSESRQCRTSCRKQGWP